MSHQATNIDANRALGRNFFLAQDRLRGGPAAELCAPSYAVKLGANPPMDLAGHQGFARSFYAGVPDTRHEIEQVIAEGDTVVVRFVIHGTHSGALFGVPPTNRKVAVGGHAILRVQDGKVAEIVGIFDEAGMLRQIGVLPAG
jgi:predicted ester cyclase